LVKLPDEYLMKKETTSKSFALAKEWLGKKVEVIVDRPLGSKHPEHGFDYEANYGFVAGVKVPDGEDLDAYFLGIDKAIKSGTGRCVAIAHRRDNDDDKLIVVGEDIEMTDEEIMSAISFQEQWFDTVLIRL
jgi:inorganic pyrophosphatase